MLLTNTHKQTLVYLLAFTLFWLVVSYLPGFIGTFVILLVGMGGYYLMGKFERIEFYWSRVVLVGLLLAQVYFALTFWSTPARNKAIIMIAVMFVFYQWFDRIEVKWLGIFLLILFLALLVVPFQVL